MYVLWTTPAAADSEEIFYYLLDRSPQAATNVILRIYEAGSSLKRFPNRGRRGREKGTRELVLPSLPYLLVYDVTKDAIRILRVLHGARRWPE